MISSGVPIIGVLGYGVCEFIGHIVSLPIINQVDLRTTFENLLLSSFSRCIALFSFREKVLSAHSYECKFL